MAIDQNRLFDDGVPGGADTFGQADDGGGMSSEHWDARAHIAAVKASEARVRQGMDAPTQNVCGTGQGVGPTPPPPGITRTGSNSGGSAYTSNADAPIGLLALCFWLSVFTLMSLFAEHFGGWALAALIIAPIVGVCGVILYVDERSVFMRLLAGIIPAGIAVAYCYIAGQYYDGFVTFVSAAAFLILLPKLIFTCIGAAQNWFVGTIAGILAFSPVGFLLIYGLMM